MVLEVLASAGRQHKEIKGIQVGKEIKLPLFADDMILYMENLTDSTKKLLEVIHEFSKVAGYKKSMYRNRLHFYTPIMKQNRKRYQGIDPIYNSTKNHKIPKNTPNQRGKRSVH